MPGSTHRRLVCGPSLRGCFRRYGSTLRDCLWLPQGADGQGEGEQQVEQQRVVGLMLKPQCGLDELRELVGSRCQPRSAPTGPILLTFGAHVPHSC